MKIVSYNINGIRASTKLGLIDWMQKYNADVYCIQEVRCDEIVARELLLGEGEQMSFLDTGTSGNRLTGYHAIFNCGAKAGYAGTLVLSKTKPDQVWFDMQEFWQDDEGRTITVVFGDLAIVNAYIPNGNSRLDFKMDYLSALTKYIAKLKTTFKVVCVGDFNIAHNEIDLTHPKECKSKSVFLPQERQAFGDLLSTGMIDCFRYLNPDEVEYSWRSYRSRTDKSYNSWKYRIDYALASNDLSTVLLYCDILDMPYSDHLPVVLSVQG